MELAIMLSETNLGWGVFVCNVGGARRQREREGEPERVMGLHDEERM